MVIKTKSSFERQLFSMLRKKGVDNLRKANSFFFLIKIEKELNLVINILILILFAIIGLSVFYLHGQRS